MDNHNYRLSVLLVHFACVCFVCVFACVCGTVRDSDTPTPAKEDQS